MAAAILAQVTFAPTRVHPDWIVWECVRAAVPPLACALTDRRTSCERGQPPRSRSPPEVSSRPNVWSSAGWPRGGLLLAHPPLVPNTSTPAADHHQAICQSSSNHRPTSPASVLHASVPGSALGGIALTRVGAPERLVGPVERSEGRRRVRCGPGGCVRAFGSPSPPAGLAARRSRLPPFRRVPPPAAGLRGASARARPALESGCRLGAKV